MAQDQQRRDIPPLRQVLEVPDRCLWRGLQQRLVPHRPGVPAPTLVPAQSQVLVNGHNHHRATLATAALSLSLPLMLADLRALAIPVGALTGLLVEPDLDLTGATHSEALVIRKMGRVIGILWQLYWYP